MPLSKSFGIPKLTEVCFRNPKMITLQAWLVLVLPGICRASVSSPYDPVVARRMLLHSDAAYCGDDLGHGSTNWTNDFSCDPCKSVDGSAVTIIGVAQGGGRDAFAYVATTHDGDIIVSFRGSVLPKHTDQMPQVQGTRPQAQCQFRHPMRRTQSTLQWGQFPTVYLRER